MFRAMETERPDALFRDPFARRLAGERGEQIFAQMSKMGDWAWVMRTHLFDRAILASIEQGVDTVVNLAAGLDARPYRLAVPPTLHWVEVDLPAILEEKEQVLRDEKPVCRLKRVPLDLANSAARRELFARVGSTAKKALVITEGLLIYLEREEVLSLAGDLAAAGSFRRWVVDLASPGLVRMLQKEIGRPLQDVGSPLKFGPPEGPAFFEQAGWKVADVQSPMKAAAKAGRLPFLLRLIAMLPSSNGRQGSRPWSGVCTLQR